MKLKSLIKGLTIKKSNIDFDEEVTDVKSDSKQINENDIFIALKGSIDGHDFCNEAIENGAKVVIIEKEINDNIPYIMVEDSRIAFALIAANYYKNCHKYLKIIGVIGTNGKTTTTHIINSILRENGYKTAIIGTLGFKMDIDRKTDLTTPDPMELHKCFFEAYNCGIEYIIMEVSAHSIYYKKISGIKFDLTVFTNVSQDHLDFFGTMEIYTNTKLSFFNENHTKIAVINIDDENGKKILENNKHNYYLTYGIENPSDVFAIDIETIDNKTRFIVNAFDEIAEISMPFLGKFNVYNAMAAIAVARVFFVPLSTIAKAFSKMQEVKGRFNILKNDITVIIDYAHTPDGLENLLKAVKDIEGNRTIIIFGCGGNRDKSKRPIMGEIAAKYSDFSIITSDNPRYENAMNIIDNIIEGFGDNRNFVCIQDRKKAIDYGIRIAEKGDKIVIAGKGGEDYIDIKGEKLPYSDKEEALTAIRRYWGD